MKKGLIALLLVLCVLMPVFAGGGRDSAGQQTFTLRFGHVLTEHDVYHQHML